MWEVPRYPNGWQDDPSCLYHMLTLLLITAIVQNVGEQTFRAMKVSQGSQELLTSFPLSLTRAVCQNLDSWKKLEVKLSLLLTQLQVRFSGDDSRVKFAVISCLTSENLPCPSTFKLRAEWILMTKRGGEKGKLQRPKGRKYHQISRANCDRIYHINRCKAEGYR